MHFHTIEVAREKPSYIYLRACFLQPVFPYIRGHFRTREGNNASYGRYLLVVSYIQNGLLTRRRPLAGECLCILVGNFPYILLSYNWSLFLHNKTLSEKIATRKAIGRE